MNRSKITWFLFLFLLGSNAYSQQVKYKDFYLTLSGMTNDELRSALKEYMVNDPDHPNANFRLAIVYEKNYKSADPLTQYAYAIGNAEQASLRYLKSRMLVDEKEVSRNNEYYFPVFKTYDAKGKPLVEFALVQKKIQNGYDSASIFLKKVPFIYKAFTKSVSKYDKAVKDFSEVSIQYLNLDDLMLLYDDKLESKLNDIKINYDSSIYYLNEYLSLIKDYPIRNHQQQYVVRPINIFRLDGLQSRVNFLTNNIQIWDYSKWVTDVQNRYKNEIVTLRKSIISEEQKLTASLAKARALQPGEMYKPVVLDRNLMFNLNTKDPGSIVYSIFQYRNFKQDFILQRNQTLIDTLALERNAQIYTQWLYSNLKADTLLSQINASISDLKLNKHREFINTYYDGMAGIRNLIKEEEKVLQNDYEQQTSRLVKTTENIIGITKNELSRQVKIGNLHVPLYILPNDSLPPDNTLHTQQIIKSSDGASYAGGVFRPDKKTNLLSVFLARASSDGKSDWIKSYNLTADTVSKEGSDSYLGPMVLTKEGCAFIIHTVSSSKSAKSNTLVYLTERGEEKLKLNLPESSFPRFIAYNEVNNGFAVALKGPAWNDDFTTKEKLIFLSYNVIGDLLWRRDIDLAGNITRLINMGDGYGIIGNYTWIVDNKNKEFRTRVNQNEVSVFFSKIKTNGEIVITRPYTLSESALAINVVKVTDNSIHIKTKQGTIAQATSKIDYDGHIMVDSFGNIIFQNLKK